MIRFLKGSIFIFFLMILVHCKVMPPQPTLLAPLALSGELKNTPSDNIEISFYGYNPESLFSGYNIYILSTAAGDTCSAATTWATLSGLAVNLTKVIPKNISTTIFPTFPPVDFPTNSTPGISSGPTKLIYTIKWDWNSIAIGSGNQYCIGVRAYNASDKITSELSNGIYCSGVGVCTGLNP